MCFAITLMAVYGGCIMISDLTRTAGLDGGDCETKGSTVFVCSARMSRAAHSASPYSLTRL